MKKTKTKKTTTQQSDRRLFQLPRASEETTHDGDIYLSKPRYCIIDVFISPRDQCIMIDFPFPHFIYPTPPIVLFWLLRRLLCVSISTRVHYFDSLKDSRPPNFYFLDCYQILHSCLYVPANYTFPYGCSPSFHFHADRWVSPSPVHGAAS